jgi:hypothetical protein
LKVCTLPHKQKSGRNLILKHMTKLKLLFTGTSILACIFMVVNIFNNGGFEIPTVILCAVTFIISFLEDDLNDFSRIAWGFNTFVWLMITAIAV